MENTYVGIANVINNLGNQSLVNRPQEINNQNISTLQEKLAVERNNIDELLKNKFHSSITFTSITSITV